jgi:hypothetical protein
VSRGLTVSLLGEKEEIQTHLELIPDAAYEGRRQTAILESQQGANRKIIHLLGREDPEVDDTLIEIFRCRSIYNQYRNKAAEKEVADYLNGQFQRSESKTTELGTLLVKGLSKGSFIFRGQPKPVSELDSDLKEAAKKFLKKVAEEVFEKYSEAPVQVESAVAERFLKTDHLDKIASKDDPLKLVKKIGKTTGIDLGHKALVSLKDYLDKYGQTDGKKLLDDFYASPAGWTP